MIEVLEEEEIAALREQQRRFRELRATERAEAKRLKEQERRLREEKVMKYYFKCFVVNAKLYSLVLARC